MIKETETRTAELLEDETIWNQKMRLVDRLIRNGGIESSERSTGYRLDPGVIGVVMEDYFERQRVINVDEDGCESDFEVDPDELAGIDYVAKHGYRFLVNMLVEKKVVDPGIAFLGGLLCKPSSVAVTGTPDADTTGVNVNCQPEILVNYLVEYLELGGRSERVSKNLLINQNPEQFGININAIQTLFTNEDEVDLIDRAARKEKLRLSHDELHTLVLFRALGHEYGHLVTDAKTFANLLDKIFEGVDFETLTDGSQRIMAITKALGGGVNEDLMSVVRRAYRREKSDYFDWVFRSAPIPKELQGQISNERIRLSSDERIADGMGLISFRICLGSLLRMRKEDDSVSSAITDRLRSSNHKQRIGDVKSIMKSLKKAELSVEVMDRALKEIDRRYGGRGLEGYNLSSLFGYYFPLKEEEVIRVLKPMA